MVHLKNFRFLRTLGQTTTVDWIVKRLFGSTISEQFLMKFKGIYYWREIAFWAFILGLFELQFFYIGIQHCTSSKFELTPISIRVDSFDVYFSSVQFLGSPLAGRWNVLFCLSCYILTLTALIANHWRIYKAMTMLCLWGQLYC